jgi:hypothetical protein
MIVGTICAVLLFPLDFLFRVLNGITEETLTSLNSRPTNTAIVDVMERSPEAVANGNSSTFPLSTRIVPPDAIALRQRIGRSEYGFVTNPTASSNMTPTFDNLLNAVKAESRRLYSTKGFEEANEYMLSWGFNIYDVSSILSHIDGDLYRNTNSNEIRLPTANFRLSLKASFSRIFASTSRASQDGSIYDIFEEELAVVNSTVVAKEEELKVIHLESLKGMEIMLLFVLDLLGRDSHAAKIFSMTIAEDFRGPLVVTSGQRFTVFLLIVCLNLICLYFAITISYSRELPWQLQFLFSFMLQITLEIICFETTFILWSCVFVPLLVKSEVRNGYPMIIEALQSEREFDVDGFNSFDYLFVSNRIARQYPHLIESMIVSRYKSMLPSPSLSMKLLSYSNSKRLTSYRSYGQRMSNALSTMSVIVMDKISSTPMYQQKLLISLFQPVVYIGVLYIYSLCVNNTILLAFLIIFLMVVLFWCLYKLTRYPSGMRIVPKVTPELPLEPVVNPSRLLMEHENDIVDPINAESPIVIGLNLAPIPEEGIPQENGRSVDSSSFDGLFCGFEEQAPEYNNHLNGSSESSIDCPNYEGFVVESHVIDLLEEPVDSYWNRDDKSSDNISCHWDIENQGHEVEEEW